ncbi:porin [Duganella sp. FT94W]|uniref:Porin n=1 Tax=Duganella lactea TaxID=2692173 RepID=A0ABW9V0K9_9BURK|nr:porin [Duganella lactea]MYM33289.1 porin [Duganella lactea]
MKQTLIGIGIGIGAWLCSTAALAQSSVSVYGIVDTGMLAERGGPGGAITKLNSGIASSSRLGFRGREDLGGELAAVWVIENGFNADTGTIGQGGVLFGRQAYAGLSGRFGAVTLGRQYTPYYRTLRDVGDPFAAVSLAGRAGNLMALNTRADNLVQYISPAIGGVRADVAYGAGEVAGDSSKNRTLSGSLGYANGALALQTAHHRIDNPAGTDRVRHTLVAASYRFSRLKAYVSHARNRGLASADSHDTLAGVALPFGRHKVMLSHVRHDDRAAANQDARQWGVGYQFALSKRTDLYAAYAAIHNERGAGFTVGTASDRGGGDRATNLGLRHSF